MQTKKRFKLNCSVVTILICLIIFGFSFLGSISSAEISTSSYCQLSIQSLQEEVSNFQELIALVNQYGDDRDVLNQQEEIKKVEFQEAKETLFLSYGITDQEYALYMGQNSRAVNEYLDANTDIKQQIDDLSEQINSLMEEYESLKGSEDAPEPPLL